MNWMIVGMSCMESMRRRKVYKERDCTEVSCRSCMESKKVQMELDCRLEVCKELLRIFLLHREVRRQVGRLVQWQGQGQGRRWLEGVRSGRGVDTGDLRSTWDLRSIWGQRRWHLLGLGGRGWGGWVLGMPGMKNRMNEWMNELMKWKIGWLNEWNEKYYESVFGIKFFNFFDFNLRLGVNVGLGWVRLGQDRLGMRRMSARNAWNEK